MSHDVDVVVVGAGVSGLTSAICLAERGRRVLVRSDAAPLDTTSCAAGAIWGPHMVTHERALDWALDSLQIFRALAAAEPAAGVALVDGVMAGRAGVSVPHPGPGADAVAECDPATLPADFSTGWRYRVPMINMPRYLTYLVKRLEATHARLELTAPVTAAELATLGPVVVNCTGLGACKLYPRDPVRPVRGDLLVADNPGIDEFFIEHDDDTAMITPYIFPQGDAVLLGGSRRDGDWSRKPEREVEEAILRRCTAVEPRLAGVRVRERRVGLRPVRPEVRIAIDAEHPNLIHNYGHGGSGVTLSWGCAQEVVRLTAAAER